MQNFSARETEWLLELDGIELAGFRRRAFAFLIDVAFAYGIIIALASVKALVSLLIVKSFGLPHRFHSNALTLSPEHEGLLPGTFFTVLYFGLLTWQGKGRSPGKRIMGIRVVSLVHRHLSLWHSIERSLGYFAAFLEGGFGFAQYFIHPYRRCVQDRIAETIVVTEQSYCSMQFKQEHPLLPDEGSIAKTHIADESLPATN
jgi:uncharacterized RDD family membrane protein YckC